MTLLQSGLAATDPHFALRIQAAIFRLAQDVLNEPPGTNAHTVRRQLAEAVIRDPAQIVPRFIWLCASNPTIAATVTTPGDEVRVDAPDSDIEYVCTSNWNTVAGWQDVSGIPTLRVGL